MQLRLRLEAIRAGAQRLDRQPRLAILTFAVVVVVALPLLLVWNRYRWFAYDDWTVLVVIDAGDVDSLLRPNNDHPSIVPYVVLRALWRVFGLHSYAPYQAVSVAVHLAAAVLLRAVMRRAAVRPWLATVTSVVFVFFGTGYENIVWVFQISYVGAVVFGLVHLLVIDHDGLDRRDALGLCAGMVALSCSGVGVVMTSAVGLAALLRRGWRVALLHVAPGALVYTTWWMVKARDDAWATASRQSGSLSNFVDFVWTALTTTFDGLGQVPGAGLLMAGLLVVGLVLRAQPDVRSALQSELAGPIGLLGGAAVFLVTFGIGRAGAAVADPGANSRYVYVLAALMLPALAVAADAVARRSRAAYAVIVVLLLAAIPGNVDAFFDARDRDEQLFHDTRDLVLDLPRASAAPTVSRSIQPDWGGVAFALTMGWLLDGFASGDIPDRGPLDGRREAELNEFLRQAQFRYDIATSLTPEERRELLQPPEE